MSLLSILGLSKAEAPPEFIREIRDIRGVRVVRLRGPVGKEIGQQAAEAEANAATSEAISRPLLLDFKETTDCDFSTVSYLVLALRQRMAGKAQVGIINPSPKLIAEMQIAKVDTWFHVYASEEQALAELSPAG
jgi:anti-anti-sigma regulatory factor